MFYCSQLQHCFTLSLFFPFSLFFRGIDIWYSWRCFPLSLQFKAFFGDYDAIHVRWGDILKTREDRFGVDWSLHPRLGGDTCLEFYSVQNCKMGPSRTNSFYCFKWEDPGILCPPCFDVYYLSLWSSWTLRDCSLGSNSRSKFCISFLPAPPPIPHNHTQRNALFVFLPVEGYSLFFLLHCDLVVLGYSGQLPLCFGENSHSKFELVARIYMLFPIFLFSHIV